MSVAFYLRTSAGRDSHAYSLPSQRGKLEAFCEERWATAWHLHKVYEDTESGRELDRPGLMELRWDARKGAFRTVLVYRLDRLSRRLRDLMLLTTEFSSLGVDLVSVSEPFDTGGPVGKACLQTLGIFAEFESSVSGERISAAQTKKAKGGLSPGGGVPYGYRKCPSGTWQINTHEAAVVQRVFSMYVEEGIGAYRIVKALNAEKVTTRAGKNWHSDSIGRMLRNPAYAGKRRWRGLHDARHRLIVPKEVFEKAQVIRSARRNAPAKRVKRVYLLSGIMRCGKCGGPMVGNKWTNAATHYYCSWRRHVTDCHQQQLRSDLLEQAVVADLKATYCDADLLERVRSNAEELLAEARKPTEQALEELGDRIAELERSMACGFEEFEATPSRSSRVCSKLTGDKGELRRLRREQFCLWSAMEVHAIPSKGNGALSKEATRLESLLLNRDPKQAKDLLRRYILDIRAFGRERLEVCYSLNGTVAASDRFPDKTGGRGALGERDSDRSVIYFHLSYTASRLGTTRRHEVEVGLWTGARGPAESARKFHHELAGTPAIAQYLDLYAGGEQGLVQRSGG